VRRSEASKNMDEGTGAGISEPAEGVGAIEACSTTGDKDRTCSCACEVLTSVSGDVTFDSRVLCAAACCACNELYSSTTDSKSVVRRSMTELGGLGCERGSSSSSRGRWWVLIAKPVG
jgi:hypothetical protein